MPNQHPRDMPERGPGPRTPLPRSRRRSSRAHAELTRDKVNGLFVLWFCFLMIQYQRTTLEHCSIKQGFEKCGFKYQRLHVLLLCSLRLFTQLNTFYLVSENIFLQKFDFGQMAPFVVTCLVDTLLMIEDQINLRSYKTDIIWNLDDLTVVSFFFFQKSGMFSNLSNLQMEKKTFDIFVWNEQIIDNITQ